ncbi:hypothetical protein [Vulcanisaeta thermophila]|uniref:hypothetical protein n=1 Tax=Vulcanisaeta thermophila TaxID=867917 RepID=UPI000853EDB7|nr:hypothetical protein [Vulcanisaeta thermophila]
MDSWLLQYVVPIEAVIILVYSLLRRGSREYVRLFYAGASILIIYALTAYVIPDLIGAPLMGFEGVYKWAVTAEEDWYGIAYVTASIWFLVAVTMTVLNIIALLAMPIPTIASWVLRNFIIPQPIPYYATPMGLGWVLDPIADVLSAINHFAQLMVAVLHTIAWTAWFTTHWVPVIIAVAIPLLIVRGTRSLGWALALMAMAIMFFTGLAAATIGAAQNEELLHYWNETLTNITMTVGNNLPHNQTLAGFVAFQSPVPVLVSGYVYNKVENLNGTWYAILGNQTWFLAYGTGAIGVAPVLGPIFINNVTLLWLDVTHSVSESCQLIIYEVSVKNQSLIGSPVSEPCSSAHWLYRSITYPNETYMVVESISGAPFELIRVSTNVSGYSGAWKWLEAPSYFSVNETNNTVYINYGLQLNIECTVYNVTRINELTNETTTQTITLCQSESREARLWFWGLKLIPSPQTTHLIPGYNITYGQWVTNSTLYRQVDIGPQLSLIRQFIGKVRNETEFMAEKLHWGSPSITASLPNPKPLGYGQFMWFAYVSYPGNSSEYWSYCSPAPHEVVICSPVEDYWVIDWVNGSLTLVGNAANPWYGEAPLVITPLTSWIVNSLIYGNLTWLSTAWNTVLSMSGTNSLLASVGWYVFKWVAWTVSVIGLLDAGAYTVGLPALLNPVWGLLQDVIYDLSLVLYLRMTGLTRVVGRVVRKSLRTVGSGARKAREGLARRLSQLTYAPEPSTRLGRVRRALASSSLRLGIHVLRAVESIQYVGMRANTLVGEVSRRLNNKWVRLVVDPWEAGLEMASGELRRRASKALVSGNTRRANLLLRFSGALHHMARWNYYRDAMQGGRFIYSNDYRLMFMSRWRGRIRGLEGLDVRAVTVGSTKTLNNLVQTPRGAMRVPARDSMSGLPGWALGRARRMGAPIDTALALVNPAKALAGVIEGSFETSMSPFISRANELVSIFNTFRTTWNVTEASVNTYNAVWSRGFLPTVERALRMMRERIRGYPRLDTSKPDLFRQWYLHELGIRLKARVLRGDFESKNLERRALQRLINRYSEEFVRIMGVINSGTETLKKAMEESMNLFGETLNQLRKSNEGLTVLKALEELAGLLKIAGVANPMGLIAHYLTGAYMIQRDEELRRRWYNAIMRGDVDEVDSILARVAKVPIEERIRALVSEVTVRIPIMAENDFKANRARRIMEYKTEVLGQARDEALRSIITAILRSVMDEELSKNVNAAAGLKAIIMAHLDRDAGKLYNIAREARYNQLLREALSRILSVIRTPTADVEDVKAVLNELTEKFKREGYLDEAIQYAVNKALEAYGVVDRLMKRLNEEFMGLLSKELPKWVLEAPLNLVAMDMSRKVIEDVVLYAINEDEPFNELAKVLGIPNEGGIVDVIRELVINHSAPRWRARIIMYGPYAVLNEALSIGPSYHAVLLENYIPVLLSMTPLTEGLKAMDKPPGELSEEDLERAARYAATLKWSAIKKHPELLPELGKAIGYLMRNNPIAEEIFKRAGKYLRKGEERYYLAVMDYARSAPNPDINRLRELVMWFGGNVWSIKPEDLKNMVIKGMDSFLEPHLGLLKNTARENLLHLLNIVHELWERDVNAYENYIKERKERPSYWDWALPYDILMLHIAEALASLGGIKADEIEKRTGYRFDPKKMENEREAAELIYSVTEILTNALSKRLSKNPDLIREEPYSRLVILTQLLGLNAVGIALIKSQIAPSEYPPWRMHNEYIKAKTNYAERVGEDMTRISTETLEKLRGEGGGDKEGAGQEPLKNNRNKKP